MLVSVSWLKKYVDIAVDTDTLARDLTMLGLNVEHCVKSGLSERAIVVGKVLEAKRHPNADKLSLCRVDVGQGEVLDVVCGAPNVASGQTVPVALVGAQMPGGLKIRKSKIRGEVSNGMICSTVELGLGSDAGGIMVLDDALPAGTVFADVLGESDDVLEIEVTPNRPDQLSHFGVAREVAALYDTGLKAPEVVLAERSAGDPCFTIEIAAPDDCYRFFGRVIRGIKVGPSPGWLSNALDRVGINSINNVVDVTNYVMMEYGQPMHAYDLKKLPARRMGVRRGRAGERLHALDDRVYELDGQNLLITDNDEAVGLAGVIGGMPTRVTDDTVDLFLESAAFNPRVIRASRRKLNISTDASYRFERGSDREICRTAADRAAGLLQEIAGGEPGESSDVYPTAWEPRSVSIRRANTRRILGLSLRVEEIAGLLNRLTFAQIDVDEHEVTVGVPSYRGDIVEEADLIEEVARLHGYDKLGEGHTFRTTTYNESDPFAEFVEGMCRHLCARGHTELVTSSFSDGRELDLMGWDEDDRRRHAIPIRNPLSANQSFLRTSLLPGVLDVVRQNHDRDFRTTNLFTCGSVFVPRPEQAGLPDEPHHLLLVRSSPSSPDFWLNSSPPADLFGIKGEVESLVTAARVAMTCFDYEFDDAKGTFTYSHEGQVVIEGGIISARLASAFDINQAVWYADLNLSTLFGLSDQKSRFRPISDYPASKRDLSVVCDPGVSFREIEKSLVKHGGRLLESLHPFDVYRGDHLPDGKTAYGVRLRFRSKEGTLTDPEVDAVVTKMVRKLESELGARLRS